MIPFISLLCEWLQKEKQEEQLKRCLLVLVLNEHRDQQQTSYCLRTPHPPAQTLPCALNRMYNNSSMRISHIFLLPAVLPTTKLNKHGAEVTTAKTQDFRSQYLPALKSDVITYSFANILSSFCCYPVSNCDGSQASGLSAENPTGLMVLVTFIQQELWDLDNTGWHTFIVGTGMSSGLLHVSKTPQNLSWQQNMCTPAVTSPHCRTHIQSSKSNYLPEQN